MKCLGLMMAMPVWSTTNLAEPQCDLPQGQQLLPA